jgi:hypothetical protein
MNELTTKPPGQLMRVGGPQPIYPHDMESAWRMATAISKSGLAPKGITTPEAIFTAMQLGAEVGLSPMSALQNIAVVNGRPTIWGDAQLALVRGSGLLESFEERYEGEGDTLKAICVATRYGYTPSMGEFSVQDAKTAGLWNKDGPWKTNPKRMLKMRARAFALRDGFTDVLKGIYSYEEASDIPEMRDVTNSAVVPAADLNKEFLSGKPTAASAPESGATQASPEPIADTTQQPSDGTQESATIDGNGNPAHVLNPQVALTELMFKLDQMQQEERVAAFIQGNGQELFEQNGSNPKTAEYLKGLGINVITTN